jgi:hypothetical protein
MIKNKAWLSIALVGAAATGVGRPLDYNREMITPASFIWAALIGAFFSLALPSASQKAEHVHIPTDHSYSDHRIALQQTVLDRLAFLNQK